jgi:tRNA-2-methylthio-N6-dimethylallyladenosine synthase
MAEKDRDEIFRRLPHVDFICGPNQLDRLVELVRQCAELAGPPLDAARGPELVEGSGGAAAPHLEALSTPRCETTSADIDDHLEAFEAGRLTPVGEHPLHAYVRVMRGCDNFCAYCVVPFVRGPQASRPPGAILNEVRRLVEQGVRHVTLLGQSIGSYRREENGRAWRLADLVRAAARTPGLLRLDFVTTHPNTLSDELLDCLAAGAPLATYLHLPAQSGSDGILRAMKRGYTSAEYRWRVARARERVPDVAIASDFIVGFPGESEADFEATLQLVRDMRYSQVFAFKYSVRPGTAAARLEDDVPPVVKQERLEQLLETHAATAIETNAALVGATLDCLVTGPSRKPHLDGRADSATDSPEEIQLAARSPGNQIVVFASPRELIGRIVPLRITRASAITLFGEQAGARRVSRP